MFKYTIFLIALLLSTTGFILYFAKITKKPIISQSVHAPSFTTKPQELQKDTTIYFAPSSVLASNTHTRYTTSVHLNSNSNKLTAVQLEMKFDPVVVSDISLDLPTPEESFFDIVNSSTLFRDIDYDQGRISYAVGINPNSQTKSGEGKLVNMTFTVRSLASGSSQITFLEKSLATEKDVKESVLRQTTPLTITF